MRIHLAHILCGGKNEFLAGFEGCLDDAPGCPCHGISVADIVVVMLEVAPTAVAIVSATRRLSVTMVTKVLFVMSVIVKRLLNVDVVVLKASGGSRYLPMLSCVVLLRNYQNRGPLGLRCCCCCASFLARSDISGAVPRRALSPRLSDRRC